MSARLSSDGTPLAGQRLNFGLGAQRRQAETDAGGQATVSLALLGLPGAGQVSVSFAGDQDYASSSAASPFTVTRQATLLSLAPLTLTLQPLESAPPITASLKDAAGRALGNKTLFFVFNAPSGGYDVSAVTDYAGRVELQDVPLSPGEYAVGVYFGGEIRLSDGTTLTMI
ncbi:MAG: hypothetical protein GY831_08505, partial [Delftia sp.]|nr:hypothetical protein [Delftia sp.]